MPDEVITPEQLAEAEVATLKNIVDKIAAGGIPNKREMEMLRAATKNPETTKATVIASRLSENQLAKLTGKDRTTIVKALDGMLFKQGASRAKLYDPREALPRIYYGESGGTNRISESESRRLLNIRRTEEIELGMEVTRRERIPLDVLEAVNDRAFSNVAGMLKAHRDKVLDEPAINDLLTELRSVSEAVRHG